MVSASFRRVLVLALGLLAAAALPTSLTANMAAPRPPGQVIGEPNGELAELHIERETLTIDMRPVENARPVSVAATYFLRNDGATRSVDLVFVAQALQNGAPPSVTLDGAPIAYRSETTSGSTPPRGVAWTPPTTTPDFGGGNLTYASRYLGAIYFTLDIQPGQHSVQVSYQAEATRLDSEPVVHWQVGYVLSPARDWASFGTLDVIVQIPPGFNFAANPPLQLSGTEARGTFAGVPADSLTLTAQYVVTPPAPNYSWPVAVAVVAAIGILLAYLGGRIIAGRSGRAMAFLPLSLIYSLLASFAVLGVGLFLRPPSTQPPVSQQPQRYLSFDSAAVGDFLLLLFAVFPLTLIGLTVLMQLVVAVSLRGRRQHPPAGYGPPSFTPPATRP